jgi:Xaa-Pro aminopeptidase
VLFWLAAGTGPLPAQTQEQRYTEWRRPTFSAEEYQARRARMLEALRSSGGGILMIPSSDGKTRGETFRQLDDFLYLTGLEVPASMLALDSRADEGVLFLPARDPRFENPGRPNDFPGRPLGSDPEVAALAGLSRTGAIDDLPVALERWIDSGRRILVNTGSSGEVAAPRPPHVGRLDPVATLIARLRADHPGVEIANAFPAIARMRMRKSASEIEAMRRAADATLEAIRRAARSVAPGVDEATLQGRFEAACRELGAQRIPFTPIVKSGPNSLWPWRILATHEDRRNRALHEGELVIFDVGCGVDGYVSDVGRTFPVGGRFTDMQREKLDMATRVADAIIAAVRPGVTFAELTRVAYATIPPQEAGHMQTPSYFGHHIGLSAGDPALMEEPLAPGMVFTVEPWYYNHELGIAVFVEDVVLVTEDGAEILTRALPRSPRELEMLLR